MLNSTVVLIRLLASLYGILPSYAECIVQRESDYDAHAVNGRHVGLCQFRADTMDWALGRMGLDWDWQAQGDPRRVPAVAIAAMLTCQRWGYWHWWSTHGLCEGGSYELVASLAPAPLVAPNGEGCVAIGEVAP